MDTTGIARLTLDSFIDRYHEQPFELLEGEIVPVSPTVARHVVIIKRLMRIFMAYEADYGGEVFSEASFVLLYDQTWVRGSRQPDVMYFGEERLRTYQANTPDWADKPFVLVPDLAIEVVSRHDSYSAVQQKVDLYVADGVRLIWIIDPQRQTATVHQAESQQQTRFTASDVLDGGTAAPGLRVELAALFAGLD